MSLMRCEKHDTMYDSDYVEECHHCEEEETEALYQLEQEAKEEQGEIKVDRSNTVQALAEIAFGEEERQNNYWMDAKFGMI